MVSTQTGKDIREEAAKARQSVPPEFLAGAHNPLSDTFETNVAALPTEQGRGANASTPDIVFIEVEGQKMAMTGPVTEQERRDTEASLRGQVLDTKRRSENAGVRSGQIELTGIASREKERIRAEQKRQADRNYRDQMLAALQAQIVKLDRQIAEYDRKIDDFENRHFTEEERKRFNALPKKDQFAAKDAAYREKVARGEMSQAEYDLWKEWNADRAQAQHERDQVAKEVKALETPEQARVLVDRHGAATSEAAAEGQSAEKQTLVRGAVHGDDETGNAERQSDIIGAVSRLESLDGEDLLDGNSSVANIVDPDGSLQVQPIQPKFAAASALIAKVEPDAQIDLTNRRQAENAAPPVNGVV